jgi:hypothetical protein
MLVLSRKDVPVRQAQGRLSGAKRVCVRTPRCVVPSGLDLREILPGTPVPGYRLSRPFGTVFSTP